MNLKHPFFGWPTRGGKLAIVNCLMWAVVALGIVTKEEVLLLPALVACWPIAWVFVLRDTLGGGDSRAGVVVTCVMIGVNSLLWGYGISWLNSLATRRAARNGARRGFEVIVRSDSNPE